MSGLNSVRTGQPRINIDYNLQLISNIELKNALGKIKRSNLPATFLFKGHAMNIFYDQEKDRYEMNNAIIHKLIWFNDSNIDGNTIYINDYSYEFSPKDGIIILKEK